MSISASDYRYSYLPQSLCRFDNGNLGKACSKQGVYISARTSEWDTNIFGFSCARIDSIRSTKKCSEIVLQECLGKVVEAMDKRGIRFCDVRIGWHQREMIHAAEANGFRLADVLNIYVSQGKVLSRPVLPAKCGYSTNIELDRTMFRELISIGKSAFDCSRFVRDSRFPRKMLVKLQENYLRSALSTAANYVGILSEKPSRLVGFAVGTSDASSCIPLAYLDVIAVTTSCHGKGYGSFLLKTLLQDLHKQYEIVEIGTQIDNAAANALYRGAGIQQATCVATLHRWAN